MSLSTHRPKCGLGQLEDKMNDLTGFYTYIQNNSGGEFDLSDTIGHYVIIEAASEAEANDRAENIGLYFNGADDCGRDCPCCGDRWHRGPVRAAEPTVYGVPVEDALTPGVWSDTGAARERALLGPESGFSKYAVIHYMDGRVVVVGKEERG